MKRCITIEIDQETLSNMSEKLSVRQAGELFKIVAAEICGGERKHSADFSVNLCAELLFSLMHEKTEKLKSTAAGFTPPTIEDVQEEISAKHLAVDAISFFNFYESKGWYVGKNKMKNWKSALQTWNRKNNISNETRAFTNEQASSMANRLDSVISQARTDKENR